MKPELPALLPGLGVVGPKSLAESSVSSFGVVQSSVPEPPAIDRLRCSASPGVMPTPASNGVPIVASGSAE
jgi:hypothetical protein